MRRGNQGGKALGGRTSYRSAWRGVRGLWGARFLGSRVVKIAVGVPGAGGGAASGALTGEDGAVLSDESGVVINPES
jgi:hypothetical protein